MSTKPSELIRTAVSQPERLVQLNQIGFAQLRTLTDDPRVKELKKPEEYEQ